jgi:predicted DNA-binding transcriptional regulator AlpA
LKINQQSLLGHLPETPSREFISEKEALKILNISRTTLWRIKTIKRYEIEGSRRIYFKLSEIENVMQVKPTPKKVNEPQREVKYLHTINVNGSKTEIIQKETPEQSIPEPSKKKLSSLTKEQHQVIAKIVVQKWIEMDKEMIKKTIEDALTPFWVKWYRTIKLKLTYKNMNQELIKQLKHRLAMISEDEKQIRKFINDNKLSKAFEEPTEVSDEAWHLLNNIEIACDLSNDESLDWTSNSK